MGATASQITSLTIVDSIVYSDADQRKHQSSASLAFVRGIHRWSVNSPHKWPVTRIMFPFGDVIMLLSGSYFGGTTFGIIESCSTIFLEKIISMAQCKTAVSPLLTHWRYCSLALNHRFENCRMWKFLPYCSGLNESHKLTWSIRMIYSNVSIVSRGVVIDEFRWQCLKWTNEKDGSFII